MSTRIRLGIAVAGSCAALVLTACSSSGGGAGSGPSSPAGGNPAPAPTGMAVSDQGGALVAANGRTLYENSVDSATSTKCTGSCASLWPPVAGPAAAASGVTASDLGTIARSDGTKQATYRGHPLYEFTGDKAAGDMSGDGVADLGGTWHVVMVGAAAAPSTSAPSSSSSSSAGGYTY